MCARILLVALISGCATSAVGDPPDAGDPDGAPLPDAALDAGVDGPCEPAAINLLGNADFEAGNAVWEEVSNGDLIIREDGAGLPFSAHAGTWAALIGGFNGADVTLSQPVEVPADASDLRLLGFRCWVTSEDGDALALDELIIELRDGGGAPLETLQEASNEDAGATCSWEPFELAVAGDHAGKSVAVAISGLADEANPTSFAFDTLALEATACPL